MKEGRKGEKRRESEGRKIWKEDLEGRTSDLGRKKERDGRQAGWQEGMKEEKGRGEKDRRKEKKGRQEGS
jgi:hypothetical protein